MTDFGPTVFNPPKPVVLCILDGWGLREAREANAAAQADTPTFDRIMATCPHATLKTSGGDVGLSDGQMGNSEVGHMNIGASRVVFMDLPKIDKAIAEGDFAANAALGDFVAKLKTSGGTAHLMGLLSPGGVHARQRHIAEAAKLIAAASVPVAIHAFLDGRDTSPAARSATCPTSSPISAAPRASRSRRPPAGSSPWTATNAGSASARPST